MKGPRRGRVTAGGAGRWRTKVHPLYHDSLDRRAELTRLMFLTHFRPVTDNDDASTDVPKQPALHERKVAPDERRRGPDPGARQTAPPSATSGARAVHSWTEPRNWWRGWGGEE